MRLLKDVAAGVIGGLAGGMVMALHIGGDKDSYDSSPLAPAS